MNQLSVLIIQNNSDDPSIIDTYLKAFRIEKDNLTIVTSFSKAIDVSTKMKFKLILIDFVSGNQKDLSSIIELIKKNKTSAIVVMANEDDDDFSSRLITSGAQDYLVKKNLTINTLKRHVNFALNRQHSRNQIQYLFSVSNALRQINRLIANEQSAAKLIQQVCKIAVELCNFTCALIILTDKNNKIEESAYYGDEDKKSYFDNTLQKGTLPACIKKSKITKKTIVIKGLEKKCELCPVIKNNKKKGVFSAKLHHRNSFFGYISFSFDDVFFDYEKEQECFEAFKKDLSFALYNLSHQQEEEKLKRALEKSEKRYRFLADNSVDCQWQMDKRLHFIYLSPSLYEITGFKPQEWKGTPLWKHVKRKEFIKIARHALKMMKEYETINFITFRTYIINKNHETIPIEIRSKPLIDEKGQLMGLQGSFHNIIQRIQTENQVKAMNAILKKQYWLSRNANIELEISLDRIIQTNKKLEIAKNKLEISEKRLITAQRIAKMGDYVWDIKTGEVTWSDAMYELIKYDKNKKINQDIIFNEIHHPADTEKVQAWLKKAISSKNEFLPPIEYRLICKDNSVIYVKTMGKFTHDKKGNPVALTGTIQDITERKKIEIQLSESKRKLKTLIENLPGIVFRCKNVPDWTMEYLSQGIKNILGWEPDEVISNKKISYRKIIHPDDRQRVWKTIQQKIKNNKTYEVQYRVLDKKNKIKWVWEKGIYVEKNNAGIGIIEGFISDITNYRHAIEKQQALTQRIHAGLHTGNLAWWEMELPSGKVIFDDRKAEMLGYSPAKFTKYQDFTRLLHPDDYQPTMKAMEDYLEGKTKEYKAEYRIKTKFGNYKWLRDIGAKSKLVKRNSKIFFIVGLVQDITNQKNAQIKLKKSEEKYRLLAENSIDCIWQVDKRLNFIYLSPSLFDLSGFKPEEWLNTPLWKHMNTKEFKRLVRIGLQMLNDYKNCKSRIFPTEFFDRKGKKIPVEIISKPLINSNGKLIGLQGSARDISERLKKEKEIIEINEELEDNNAILLKSFEELTLANVELEESKAKILENEEKHRFLFENMTQGVVYHNHKGQIIYANKSASEILGLTIDQLKGKTSHEPEWKSIYEDGTVFPGDKHPAVITLKTGKEIKNQIMGVYSRQKEGCTWININSIPKFKNGHKKPYLVMVTFEDVTERKELEQKLKKYSGHLEELVEKRTKELEQVNVELKVNYEELKEINLQLKAEIKNRERLQALHQNLNEKYIQHTRHMPLPYIELTKDYAVANWNDAAYNLLGYKENEVLFKDINFKIEFEESKQEFKKFLNQISQKKKPDSKIFNIITKDAKLVCEWHVTPFLVKDNQIQGLIIIINDITNLIEAEQKLRFSLKKEKELNKLKSGFVSMTSHQFRTPLTTILSSSELLEMNMDMISLSTKMKKNVSKYIQRIKNEVKRLDDLMSDVLELGRNDLGKIPFHPQKTDIIKLCDELINNHVFTAKGNRTVKLEVEGKKEKVFLDPKLVYQILVNFISNAFKYSKGNPVLKIVFSNKYLHFHIIDNGIGISENDKKHLFTSFFRANNVQDIKGTGLGLVIAKQYIELHKGEIEVKSKINKGTEFIIKIPKETNL